MNKTTTQFSDTRPDDYLPYVCGYMDAMGGEKQTDPDLSPEYFQGHDRGMAVKNGLAKSPPWINQTNPNTFMIQQGPVIFNNVGPETKP